MTSPAIRRYYQGSLETAERLVEGEPDRADRAWDLVVSLLRVASLDPTQGRPHLTRALGILRSLHQAGRLWPEQIEAMESLEQMLRDEPEPS